jgi:hypothetical protein
MSKSWERQQLQPFVDTGGDIMVVDPGVSFASVHAHSAKVLRTVHSFPCSTPNDFVEDVVLLSSPSLLSTSIS